MLKDFGRERWLFRVATRQKLFQVLKENGVWVMTTQLCRDLEDQPTQRQVQALNNDGLPSFKTNTVTWQSENVGAEEPSGAVKRAEAMVTMITRMGEIPDGPEMEDSLMGFHLRLGHLNFDTIVKLAKDPRSGIKLTDDRRRVCVACAEGKQTKNNQAKKDSGKHSPIDRIGGVICADNKGPITPPDRYGNRYIAVFVDHRSSYCRAFLDKTKSGSSDKFGHFMAFFERMNDCRIHILRSDGGKEFRATDLLCERMGIGRQQSEPYNQASNGKAEKTIRKILELARTVLLASNLPISFWGEAVLYASYMLNRLPTRSNEKNKSPLEV